MVDLFGTVGFYFLAALFVLANVGVAWSFAWFAILHRIGFMRAIIPGFLVGKDFSRKVV